jgi:hypothetical protein
MSGLLVKFKSKDSPYAVSRDTLKTLAEEMAVSETAVVHLALSRFAKEMLPAYEMDEGPLTPDDIAHVRQAAQPMLPKGNVATNRSLL